MARRARGVHGDVQPTLALRGGSAHHRRLFDERLAALSSRGDAAAFEALYDRHHAALLAFRRHRRGAVVTS
jgi:hypothetical protein